MELTEVPARNLAYHVFHVRLIERSLDPVGRILDLRQFVAEADLGGDEGERVSRSLRSQGGRAAQAGVDLDDAVVHRGLVVGELDVALAHYAQVADYLLGQFSQVLHILL